MNLIDKYRPNTIDEMILAKPLKLYLNDIIKNGKEPPNFLFVGLQGIGKTTLTKILSSELNSDVLFIPCAIEGNVDVLRNKITQFISSMSLKPFKVVILDEIDGSSASGDSSFQKGLRNVIDSAPARTKFFCTANYPGNVIDPIKSRCKIINISFSKNDIIERLSFILNSEKIINVDLNILVNRYFPDIRLMLNTLQSGEELKSNKTLLQTIIEDIQKNKPIKDIREFCLTHFFGDWRNLSEELFKELLINDIVTKPGDLFQLGNIIFNISQVPDKELGFITFLCKLSTIIQKT